MSTNRLVKPSDVDSLESLQAYLLQEKELAKHGLGYEIDYVGVNKDNRIVMVKYKSEEVTDAR